MADAAECGGHVLGHPLAIGIGVGFLEIAIQGNLRMPWKRNPFSARIFCLRRRPVPADATRHWREASRRESGSLHGGGLLFKRDTQGQNHAPYAPSSMVRLSSAEPEPWAERTSKSGRGPIDDDARGIEIVFGAETVDKAGHAP